MKGRIKKIYYGNVFLYSSLQFMGNVEEYFAMHTRKLVVFVIMPRQQYDASLIRLYQNGKLIEQVPLTLSRNIFFYYVLWYVSYVHFLFKYFSKGEKIWVITFHPISLFGMTIQKLFRKIEFVFWDGDYFPPVDLSLILFEKLKKFYNSKVNYACYLSDAINEKMNKIIVNTFKRKTVMWGILPRKIERKFDKRKFTVLFVGVIKASQGLEFLFEFIKENRQYSAKIVGICTGDLYQRYTRIIQSYGIQNQIFFPNRFFSDKELNELSKDCQVGIAFYDTDQTSATYYTDPGKVKTYAALGLPIIMSHVSSIASYIKKFKCGIVIDKTNIALSKALHNIRTNYPAYLDGVRQFNKYFYYDSYYRQSFRFLEEL